MNLSISQVHVPDPDPWTAADCRMNEDGSAILVAHPISFWGGCSSFSCDVGCGSKRDTQSDSRESLPLHPGFSCVRRGLDQEGSSDGMYSAARLDKSQSRISERLTGYRIALLY